MKLSNLIPDDCYESEQMVYEMLHRMAKRIDFLEGLVGQQKDDIAYQADIIDCFRKRIDLSHENYICIDSVFKHDSDYELVREYFGEEE